MRVFCILGTKGKKVDKGHKISLDLKDKLLKLMCRDDLTQAKLNSLQYASKGRGLRKSFLREGVWRCLLDVLKSHLMGASRASDIAMVQVVLMNGIHNGMVYD